MFIIPDVVLQFSIGFHPETSHLVGDVCGTGGGCGDDVVKSYKR